MLSTFLKAASSVQPIEYIGSSTTQIASGGSIVVSKPSGTTEGDLMIMFGSVSGPNRTWTGDTGWTEVIDQNERPSLRVAYKLASSSEPSTYTFSLNQTTSSGASASILTYRNASYDTIGSITTGTNPLVLPSVTAASNFSFLIAFGARGSASITLGTPTGMTARVTENDATGPSYKICDESINAGASGTRSMSTGSTTEVGGLMLVIKPK